MSDVPMMLDPRVAEYRDARHASEQGLTAPEGARERYRTAIGPYIQCMAEHTPSHVRSAMMEALFDGGLPLGAIAAGFRASQAEMQPLMERPVYVDAGEDEIARLQALPYGAYLKTAHWNEVRTRALERAEYRCTICNADQNLEVHHRSYERKGCERDADVNVVCRVCHRRHHQQQKAAA